MIVYLVCTSITAQDGNGNVRHRFPDGELSIFKDEGDDVKLLAFYPVSGSSRGFRVSPVRLTEPRGHRTCQRRQFLYA